MSTSRRIGTDFERRMAKKWATRRTINRGEKDKDDADLVHPVWWIQCRKRGETAFKSLYEWYKEEEEAAAPYGKIPILLLYAKNRRRILAVLDEEYVRVLAKFFDEEPEEKELKAALAAVDERERGLIEKLSYLRRKVRDRGFPNVGTDVSEMTHREMEIEMMFTEYILEKENNNERNKG
jgi:hypothetical protein